MVKGLEVENKIEKLITHHGLFHADDVLAVALYKYFKNNNVTLERVHHNTTVFDPEAILIDIGLDYNGVNHFDHHQYKHGLSACALVWILVKRELKAECKFLDKLVKEVSDADVGLARQSEQHYSGLIAKLNGENTHDHVDQLNRFYKAVETTISIIDNAYKTAINLKITTDYIKTATIKDGIIELPNYLKGWVGVVSEMNIPKVIITHVIWPNKYTDEDTSWSIQVPNIGDTFELVAAPMKRSNYTKFVHPNGYYATVQDKENLDAYLKEIQTGIVNKNK